MARDVSDSLLCRVPVVLAEQAFGWRRPPERVFLRHMTQELSSMRDRLLVARFRQAAQLIQPGVWAD